MGTNVQLEKQMTTEYHFDNIEDVRQKLIALGVIFGHMDMTTLRLFANSSSCHPKLLSSHWELRIESFAAKFESCIWITNGKVTGVDQEWHMTVVDEQHS